MSVRLFHFLAPLAFFLVTLTLSSSKVEDGSSREYGDRGDVVISGCEKLLNSPQKVPDRKYWSELRNAYVASVGKEHSTISSSWPLAGDDPSFSGFVVPIEVRVTPEMGRGVYAAAPVPKGSSVWNDLYHAIFTNETSFRQFLSSIRWEQACDVLQWAYAFEYDENNHVGVGCCLDEASLFNHANESLANVGYPDAEASRCVALRDIEEGEELLQDYGSFEEDLEWFEDLTAAAWGESDFEWKEKDEL